MSRSVRSSPASKHGELWSQAVLLCLSCASHGQFSLVSTHANRAFQKTQGQLPELTTRPCQAQLKSLSFGVNISLMWCEHGVYPIPSEYGHWNGRMTINQWIYMDLGIPHWTNPSFVLDTGTVMVEARRACGQSGCPNISSVGVQPVFHVYSVP